MYLVDSHCHIDGEAFDADREEVIERALSTGIVAMLNVGTGSPSNDSFERTVKLAREYESIFASIGIHPHDAKEYSIQVEERLIRLAVSNEKVIAWGEIGLDFYYDHSPRKTQIEVFRRQIEIAIALKLPVIVHSREAEEDTLSVLLEYASDRSFSGGIMHCFSGSEKMAQKLIERGFLISFAGNVTFKKAEQIRKSAGVVPLDKILIETDSPFLSPVPLRGRRCEPSFVKHTAEFLARLHQIDLEELAYFTTINFLNFFLSRGRAVESFMDLISKARQ